MSALTLSKREVLLGFKESGGTLAALAFFAASLTLFTFALGVEVQQRVLMPLLATLMAFATLLSLSQIFERDAADGTLEQLCLMPMARETVVACKWLALIVGLQLPLVAAAILASFVQGNTMPVQQWAALGLLALVMVAIGILAAALALLSEKPALVRVLIALPLMMPPLIFVSVGGATLWLAAMALVLTPLAISVSAWVMRECCT